MVLCFLGVSSEEGSGAPVMELMVAVVQFLGVERRARHHAQHSTGRGDLPSFILNFRFPFGFPTKVSPRFVFWGVSNAMMAAVCRMSCLQLHRGVKNTSYLNSHALFVVAFKMAMRIVASAPTFTIRLSWRGTIHWKMAPFRAWDRALPLLFGHKIESATAQNQTERSLKFSE